MSPEEFTLEESIGYWAQRAARALTNDLNKGFSTANLAVTVEQWRVLVYLHEQDGLTQNELCERMLQEKTGVSRLIDGLEKRSLVVRVPDQLDRRSKRIYLSRLGRSLQSACVEQAVKTLEKAREGIGEEELEVCRNTLRKIIQNLTG